MRGLQRNNARGLEPWDLKDFVSVEEVSVWDNIMEMGKTTMQCEIYQRQTNALLTRQVGRMEGNSRELKVRIMREGYTIEDCLEDNSPALW